MVGELQYDKNNKVIDATLSDYQPEKEVADFTFEVKKDYQTGLDILNRPFLEFGGEGLTLRAVGDRDQKAFNSFEEATSSDPDESWHWKGVRPTLRNKIIAIAAYYVATLLFPNIFAQNENDEEDKDAANLMRDLIIFNIENSNYKISYLYGVIAALVYPVAYLKVEFLEAIQKAKEKLQNGDISVKEAIDEVFSGFQLQNVPMDEIFINNAYEYELQRQKCLIRRRFINYGEAQRLFGKHKNFKHIKAGIKTLYDAQTSQFFDISDRENPDLVEELTYYSREEDLEVPFVNGVYLGASKVAANLMRHRRIAKTKNKEQVLIPIYPFVKYGYGPIDEKRFFFYKSAANELGPQKRLIDRMWQMVVDGTFLETIPPLAVVGNQIINSHIVYPGAITTFKDKDTSINPLLTGGKMGNAFNALTRAEMDMSETSKLPQYPFQSGTSATEVAKADEQAKIQLGLFGQMIGEMVVQLGRLMIDVIIQHQTVGEVEEITAGDVKMKYRKFTLFDQTESGKKVTKQIEFTDQEFKGTMDESMGILDKEGGLDSDKRIYLANPTIFRRLKFLCRIDPDKLQPKNEMFDKVLGLEFFSMFRDDPYINQEKLRKDTVEIFKKGESSEYIKKPSEMMNMGQQQGQPERPKASSLNSMGLAGLLKR